MAVYKNQSDMFRKRAESCKKSGDINYAKAMEAKDNNNTEDYKKYMAKAQHYYKCQKDNEALAKKHEGETWK